MTGFTYIQDNFEYWVMNGLIINNSNSAAMSIEVEIQALNASGNSIYSEVAVAFGYAITSGETCPFNRTI